MCSDLLQLGSPRIAPIPAMLDYFAEILHTVGSFLEVVKDQHPQGTALADADVPSRPDKAMLRLEYSLARILKDIVDILPASAHVMVRALSQFTSTVVLLSQVPPLTKALPVRRLALVYLCLGRRHPLHPRRQPRLNCRAWKGRRQHPTCYSCQPSHRFEIRGELLQPTSCASFVCRSVPGNSIRQAGVLPLRVLNGVDLGPAVSIL